MADELRVGFIGGGNMARAIADGLIKSDSVKPGNITASAITQETLAAWQNLGCQTTLVNKDVLECSDVVFFAVKPHLIVQVVREIAPYVNPDKHLFVTVAAAMRTEVIEQHLPPNTHLIRVQPNLACAVQCGVSAFCRGKFALEKDAQLIHKLLLTCGLCVEVKESSLNAVSSISGCGVGFLCLVIEALSDGGVRVGLPRTLSMQLVAQTMIGAGRLIQETGKHPGQLKDEVSSPGGTTIAGIQTLERSALRSALIDAVETATKRATEIAEQGK